MINWITSNIGSIGSYIALATFLLSVGTFAFSAYRYVTTRRDAQLQIDFENYHKLIAELVGSQRNTETMKLDSQVAIVYELQRFKRYKPVTVRILSGLRDEWSGNGSNNSRLISEMNIAIEKLS
ncbi:hypothetical protein ACFOD0_11085 [Shewanella intestini]|uniref:Uncharacterized protein n=1 Tax=Shewanella intestini TaxID=2017544 RepID=A0ABS5I6K7_9GAMM|nr:MULTISPECIES: hypothetical protein [Shewanella]MBR9729672.1 hypothetical protein [Shewanella intestini]MRG37656.1 hypothetical protein [Shewanella sp. XMDDZSB0408]